MMFTVRRIAVGVPLLVISAIAGQLIFSSKVTGDMVSAYWDGGQAGNVSVSPVDTADGRAYQVFWRGCILNPDFEHRYCTFAGGLVPSSAIKAEQVGRLGLNLDVSMLSATFAESGEDCRSGNCIPFVPLSVPLNGTFTITTGPGSYSEQSNGSTRSESILPFGGITMSQSFNGMRARYSAVFEGTVGLIVVVPGVTATNNASLSIMKGQQSAQTVYPPMP